MLFTFGVGLTLIVTQYLFFDLFNIYFVLFNYSLLCVKQKHFYIHIPALMLAGSPVWWG